MHPTSLAASRFYPPSCGATRILLPAQAAPSQHSPPAPALTLAAALRLCCARCAAMRAPPCQAASAVPSVPMPSPLPRARSPPPPVFLPQVPTLSLSPTVPLLPPVFCHCAPPPPLSVANAPIVPRDASPNPQTTALAAASGGWCRAPTQNRASCKRFCRSRNPPACSLLLRAHKKPTRMLTALKHWPHRPTCTLPPGLFPDLFSGRSATSPHPGCTHCTARQGVGTYSATTCAHTLQLCCPVAPSPTPLFQHHLSLPNAASVQPASPHKPPH